MTKATIAIRLTKQVCLVCTAILWLAGLSFGQAAISLSPTSGPLTTSTMALGEKPLPDTSEQVRAYPALEVQTVTPGDGRHSRRAR